MTRPERALALAYAGTGRAWLQAALALDERLAKLARRPGEPALASVRLLWWEEAVLALGSGPSPVDPILLALQPLVAQRPDRVELVVAVVRALDEVAQASPGGREWEAVASARGRLLADEGGDGPAATALAGRALAEAGGDGEVARQWLEEGLSERWGRALRGQRLLARAALYRLRGGSERMLAARLIGWAVSGR